MKKIKLRINKVNRHTSNDCPLVDERDNPVDLDDFSNSLIQKLWDWDSEYDWFYTSKITPLSAIQFEQTSLDLVRCLLEELPDDTKLIYYSELFKTDIEF